MSENTGQCLCIYTVFQCVLRRYDAGRGSVLTEARYPLKFFCAYGMPHWCGRSVGILNARKHPFTIAFFFPLQEELICTFRQQYFSLSFFGFRIANTALTVNHISQGALYSQRFLNFLQRPDRIGGI